MKDQDLGGILASGQLDGMKGSGMTLKGLRNLLLDGVELHVAVDGTTGAGRDATNETPLAVGTGVVVDDLSVGTDGRVTIKHLDGGGIALNGPVVDGSGGDEAEVGGGRPLPKDDRLRHVVRLELGLGIEVEDLEGRAGAEGEDVGDGVHDGSLGLDGTAGDGGVVLQVDHRDLAGFDGNDPLVGRHGRETMLDGGLGNSELLELWSWCGGGVREKGKG